MPIQFGIPAILLGVEKIGLVAGLLEGLNERRHFIASPFHRNAPGRKIDAGLLDAFDLAERAFYRPDAGGAVNCGHRKIDLAKAVLQVAAGEKQFLA